MTTLAELRLNLVEVKAELRDAKDAHDTIKAMCEHAAIESGAAGGKNAEERARSLVVCLAHTDEYQSALAWVRDRELTIDRLNAQIAVEEDAIRAAELRARERLAAALMGRTPAIAADDRALDRCQEFSRTPALDTEEWFGR